ncbi:LOW QUALITY PROTEIN: hypothetical protein GGTG_08429 [Gaeumannomyces tritici R3-111a-1]|uniref:Uncharacterized protein n=1 Tax=Gaeumannomyces tritici (strain R3-111a-1) TaxID=644352 RepID=J3P4J2_GAET3|nr:LOW QUALITY PROTEIN: hypothetical protein GGTG_08429 [Gaeumannomyces tritici R3-111a-1]EJT74589.1 LOW QUALITY PROTEIN: hypothetical protein GGTG_08429 [Gaeumannomyces tritici R3-111a-1]
MTMYCSAASPPPSASRRLSMSADMAPQQHADDEVVGVRDVWAGLPRAYGREAVERRHGFFDVEKPDGPSAATASTSFLETEQDERRQGVGDLGVVLAWQLEAEEELGCLVVISADGVSDGGLELLAASAPAVTRGISAD